MQIYFLETEDDAEDYFCRHLDTELHDLFFVSALDEVGADAEILTVFISTRVDAAFLDAHPKLRLVATRSASLGHIDVDACRERGVRVANVVGYGDTTVAEHTFALILALSRRIREAMESTRGGRRRHSELRGFDLKGKTLGVLGAGRVGLMTICIAKGFGMRVLAYDVNEDTRVAEKNGFTYVSFEELLQHSHILTIHLPPTPETHHLFNAAAFARCRAGVLIVNTAHGSLIDTGALLQALQEGKVAGAGLDVLEEERVMKSESASIIGEQIVRNLRALSTGGELRSYSQQRVRELREVIQNKTLLSQPNVVVTPHVAYNSVESMESILAGTLANIRETLTPGEKTPVV